jgi:tryptophan synthase alpha chain
MHEQLFKTMIALYVQARVRVHTPTCTRSLSAPSRPLPGLLVPDIPLEETGTVRAACERAGLELVLLVTPTTPKQRMADIARASQGFVYLVSVTGVTGVQERVQARVEGLIDLLHSVTDKSIAVGFGVSRPEQARQIVEWGAEGVICGSALVRALGEAETPAEGLAAMEQLAKSLRDAIPQ